MDKIVYLSLARKSVPTLIDVVQGATAPNIVFVLEDYTPPSNARARLYIKKTNAEVYNDCVLSGNQVTYTPTAGSFDEAGQCVAQLQIVQGNTIAVSWRMFVAVEPNLIEGSAAPASTEYGALESLIINAQQYDTIIGANNLTGANNRQGWTEIPSAADLDTYGTEGIYYTSTDAIAKTILNRPQGFDTVFKLEVSGNGKNANFLEQKIIPANKVLNGKVATRRTTGKSSGVFVWGDWNITPTATEVNAIANQGAKNLLPNNIVSQTVNGLTVTKNADGSVTINGTATSNTRVYMWNSQLQASPFEAGDTFLMSGCSGGSTETYRIQLLTNGTIRANCFDGSVTATIPASTTATQTVQFAIQVLSGVVMDNVTFYPMLRYSSVQDDTYVPYGMTNAELTDYNKRFFVSGTNADYDLNELPTSQVLASQNSTNTPVASSWFFVETFEVDTNGAFQRATGFYPTTVKGKVYSRVKQGGTWSEWTQL